jgi:hypothetical protein
MKSLKRRIDDPVPPGYEDMNHIYCAKLPWKTRVLRWIHEVAFKISTKLRTLKHS